MLNTFSVSVQNVWELTIWKMGLLLRYKKKLFYSNIPSIYYLNCQASNEHSGGRGAAAGVYNKDTDRDSLTFTPAGSALIAASHFLTMSTIGNCNYSIGDRSLTKKGIFFFHDVKIVFSRVFFVPFEENGQVGQEEGRCSGGDTHHSASGNALHVEVKVRSRSKYHSIVR